MSCVAALPLDMGSPLSDIVQVFAFFGFQFDLINVECALPQSFLALYLCKVLVIVAVAFVVTLGEGVRTRVRRSRYHFDHVVNTIGAFLLAFFIMMTLALLSPFQCFDHPGGHHQALVQDPRIFCWESGGEHVKLVILSVILVLLFPVTILSVCIFLTMYLYPRKVMANDLVFAQRFRFLFFRWKPTNPATSVIRLVEGFVLASVPMVVPGEYLYVQVTLMFCTLLAGLMGQMITMPWRVKTLNYLDSMIHAMGLIMLFACSLALPFHGGLTSTFSMATATIICLGLAGTVVFIVHQFCASRPRQARYSVFLSHHKSAAGCTARMLKYCLEKDGGQCFLDADHLTDTDQLFDAVRNSKNVVVLLSGATLTRPWCVGEIVTAKQCGINVIPVVVVRQQTETIDVLQSLSSDGHDKAVQDMCIKLAKYGISEDMIRSALAEFLQTPSALINVQGGEAEIQEGIRNLVSKLNRSQRSGDPKVRSMYSRFFSSSPSLNNTSDITLRRTDYTRFSHSQSNLPYAYISGDPTDHEAFSASYVLKLKLQKQLQEPVFIDAACSDEDASCLIASMHHGRVVVLLTRGSFTSAQQLARLVLLHRQPNVHILPVLGVSGEDILTSGAGAILERLVKTGAPLAGSVREAERMLCQAAGEPIRLEEVASAIELLCKRIMEKFDASMDSESKLDMVAHSLAKQIKHFDVSTISRYSKTLLQQRFHDHPCQPTVENGPTTFTNGNHEMSKMQSGLDKHTPQVKIPVEPEADLEAGIDTQIETKETGQTQLTPKIAVDLEAGVDVQIETRGTVNTKLIQKVSL